MLEVMLARLTVAGGGRVRVALGALLAWAAASAGGAFAAGCGPNHQVRYEADLRFERCYALDDSSAAMAKKAECWRTFRSHFREGQSSDRIRYAAMREEALKSEALPTDEGLMLAAPGALPDTGRITAPAPTSLFAPPPKVLASAPPPAQPPSFEAASVPELPSTAASVPPSASASSPEASAPPSTSGGKGSASTTTRKK